MTEKNIDARGMLCPKPLILTKQGLNAAQPGDVLSILLDNTTARDNVMRFLQDCGTKPACSDQDGFFAIRVEAVKPGVPVPRPEEYCRPASSPPSFVMVINRACMGTGSDELGKILMQACINSVKEVTPLPSALLFYNGGVHLTCEGSPVLAALTDLEGKGVKMLVCGTCLDYFALKPALKVGRVSNMYDIMQTIASAGTVFAP